MVLVMKEAAVLNDRSQGTLGRCCGLPGRTAWSIWLSLIHISHGDRPPQVLDLDDIERPRGDQQHVDLLREIRAIRVAFARAEIRNVELSLIHI